MPAPADKSVARSGMRVLGDTLYNSDARAGGSLANRLKQLEEVTVSKFIVVVFPGEAQAYQGTRALKELHAEGSLTLYGIAVLAKDAKGDISTKEAADAGPLGTAVGALVGGLIGVIGGPAGAAAGLAGGALIGSLSDLFNYGIGQEFLSKVSAELAPGKAALIAEVAETWTIPLDTRMEAHGGTVLRTWRADVEDEQIEKEIAARRAELEQLKAEYAQARQETKAKLKAKLDQAKADLKRADGRAKAKLLAVDQETKAKIAALEKQLTDARDVAREKINQRIAALRADYDKRSAKLKQAWQLTKEALAA